MLVRCQNICCCIDARTGSVLAGALALFSSFYYLFIGSMGFTSAYHTIFLVNIGSLLVGTLSLLAGMLMLMAFVTNSINLVVAFVGLYSVCAYFRGILIANAIIVLDRWSRSNWRRSQTYDAGKADEYTVVLRQSQIACIINLMFVTLFFILDCWAIMSAIVWGSQMRRAHDKIRHAAEEAAANGVGSVVMSADDVGIFTTITTDGQRRPSVLGRNLSYVGSMANLTGGSVARTASIASSMSNNKHYGSHQQLVMTSPSAAAATGGGCSRSAANMEQRCGGLSPFFSPTENGGQRRGSRASLMEMHELVDANPAHAPLSGGSSNGRLRVRKVRSHAANMDILPRLEEPAGTAGEDGVNDSNLLHPTYYHHRGSSSSRRSSGTLSPMDAVVSEEMMKAKRGSKLPVVRKTSSGGGSGSEDNGGGLVLRRHSETMTNGHATTSNGGNTTY